MRKLLTVDAWLIFAVIFGIPFGVWFLAGALISDPFSSTRGLLQVLSWLAVRIMFAGWVGILGVGMYRRPADYLKPSIMLFIPCVLIMLLGEVLAAPIALMVSVGEFDLGSWGPVLICLLVFSWLFVLHFLAKSLVAGERQADVTFKDYWGSMILFFIYPVGVWFLQPRVQELFSNESRKNR